MAGSPQQLRRLDVAKLVQHFADRSRHERRDYSGFGVARMNRLADGLKEFRGPEFDALFGIYQSQRGPGVAAELARMKAARRTPNGAFESQLLPYSYAFLGRS